MLCDIELKNRVVLGPHRTNLAKGRSISEELLEYYKTHIDGGAAVLVTESASVTLDDWPYEYAPLAQTCAQGWAELAIYGAKHQCLVVASLSHAGFEGTSSYSQYALVGPSLLADVDSNELPRVATKDDILEITEAFFNSARLAWEAGLKAVEINASFRSLLRQFLSPLSNSRNDEYGKDPTLFLRQVLERIKTQLPSLILGIRLSFDELTPWGGIDQRLGITTLLQLDPFVDYAVVTTGGLFTKSRYRSNSRYPYPSHGELIRKVKQSAKPTTLVVAQGSFFDVGDAESALATESCDLVEMTRALITEPNLVNKIPSSKDLLSLSIKPCLGCNQACNPQDSRNIPVDCIINPRELDRSKSTYLEPRLYPKSLARDNIQKVHIIGAGIAGMELALRLGRRNKDVIIYEKERHFGGLIALYHQSISNSRYDRLLSYYQEQLLAMKSVDIRLEYDIKDQDDLVDLCSNDLVVLASGAQSTPLVYSIPPHLYLPDRTIYLEPERYEGASVAVVDPRGNTESVTTTEQLAKYAGELNYFCEDPAFGSQIAHTGDLMDSIRRLKGLSVNLFTFTEVQSIQDDGQISLRRRFSTDHRKIKVDFVHEIGGRVGSIPQAFGSVPHVSVGDVRVARNIYNAVSDAQKLDLYLQGSDT